MIEAETIASLGHPWFTQYLVRVDGVPAAAARRATFEGRELPVLDRHRGVGARARPGQPRDAGRGRPRPSPPAATGRTSGSSPTTPSRSGSTSEPGSRASASPPRTCSCCPDARARSSGSRPPGWPPRGRAPSDRGRPARRARLGDGRPRAGRWPPSRPPWASRTTRSCEPPSRSSSARAACVAYGGHCPAATALAILEPSTEGRLAATLARLDEGPHDRLVREGPATSAAGAGPARPGPFGPERLRRRRPHPRTAPAPDRGRAGYHRRHDRPGHHRAPPRRRRPTPNAIAALFTDEGYPAGPSDIVARLERFATPRGPGRRRRARRRAARLHRLLRAAALRARRLDRPDRRPRGRRRRPRAWRRPDAHGRGRAGRPRARCRVHRAHRRPSPARGPPSLRVDSATTRP